MSINIGPLELRSPVVLAPMSGVTDQPFRAQVRGFGAGLVVSEMIASQAMIRETRRHMLKSTTDCAAEYPMSVQIAGCEPTTMAEAARLSEARGAAVIDINFGCPVKKVVGKLAGSALMRDLNQAARIIRAVVGAVSVPVTVKMRTGWDDAHRNAPELARIAEDLGVAMIAVHGRTRTQAYKGKADWAYISEIKRAVSVPVLANGDIVSVADARACLARSGADGVMIGRGAYGRPWFVSQIMQALAGEPVSPTPGPAARLNAALRHYEAMLEHYGLERGIKVARKHLAWYCAGLPGAAEARAHLFRLEDAGAVTECLRSFFLPAAQRAAA
ncbi:MAG TPA: tRNA dihydrouridine synthase DusB [Alphaproteobacteria bacterium]|nr:tRNA dihydrouridine synthase DusB [Alphaproteobacteria bacterium]